MSRGAAAILCPPDPEIEVRKADMVFRIASSLMAGQNPHEIGLELRKLPSRDQWDVLCRVAQAACILNRKHVPMDDGYIPVRDRAREIPGGFE